MSRKGCPNKRELIDRRGPVVHRRLGRCWVWLGGKTWNGYGTRRVNGRRVRAHRHAYSEAYGAEPGELFVCHRCDNPLCVRPSHLFLGTNSDNMRDCFAKGRLTLPSKKLDSADIPVIRKRLKAGERPALIAIDYLVARSTIDDIRDGKTWLRVKGIAK